MVSPSKCATTTVESRSHLSNMPTTGIFRLEEKFIISSALHFGPTFAVQQASITGWKLTPLAVDYIRSIVLAKASDPARDWRSLLPWLESLVRLDESAVRHGKK